MKTKEELTALKEETETMNKNLRELREEELAQVTGGVDKDEVRKTIFQMMRDRWNVRELFGSCSIVDDLGADSLDVVDILQSVEDEFNIRLPESGFLTVHTVDDLCDLVVDTMKL